MRDDTDIPYLGQRTIPVFHLSAALTGTLGIMLTAQDGTCTCFSISKNERNSYHA
jgi:hypothetical protein